jgi:hypothetical protein
MMMMMMMMMIDGQQIWKNKINLIGKTFGYHKYRYIVPFSSPNRARQKTYKYRYIKGMGKVFVTLRCTKAPLVEQTDENVLLLLIYYY